MEAKIFQNQNPEHSNMVGILLKLFGGSLGKFLFAAWFSLILGYFIPIYQFLLLTVGMVVVDTVSGIIAAIRAGVRMESRKFYRLVEKILVYFGAIIVSHGINMVFIVPLKLEWIGEHSLATIAAGSICFTEFLSLRKNIQKITGVDILGGFKRAYETFLKVSAEKDTQQLPPSQ